jgi:hypothetical protein
MSLLLVSHRNEVTIENKNKIKLTFKKLITYDDRRECMITCGVFEIVYILIFQLIYITSWRIIICSFNFLPDDQRMSIKCSKIKIKM